MHEIITTLKESVSDLPNYALVMAVILYVIQCVYSMTIFFLITSTTASWSVILIPLLTGVFSAFLIVLSPDTLVGVLVATIMTGIAIVNSWTKFRQHAQGR